MAWYKQLVPRGNRRKTNVRPEEKKERSRKAQCSLTPEKAAIIPLYRSPAQVSLDKLKGQVRGKTAKEGNTMASVSFSKRASVVSCCSGPLMLTHMRTQEKNPHGTLPET